jgi:hypothetical protein
MGLLDFSGLDDMDFLPPTQASADAWMRPGNEMSVNDLWGGNPLLQTVQNAAQPADLSSLEQQLEAVFQNPKATEAERQQAIAGLQEIRRQQALLAPIASTGAPPAQGDVNFKTITDYDLTGQGFGAQAAYNGLIDRNVHPLVAQSAVGNMGPESRWNPNATGDYMGGKPTAFGLIQARLDRADRLNEIAAGRGTTWRNPEAQLDHITEELSGAYRPVADKIIASGDPAKGGYIFGRDYERPATWALKQSAAQRMAYAEAAARGDWGALQGGARSDPTGRDAPVQVASADPSFAPIRNTVGGPLSSAVSRGKPGMADSTNPSGLLELLGQVPKPQGGGMGDLISALGMSMLTSTDRRQPFNGQVLAQALALNDKKSEQHQAEAAMAAAVLKIGLTKDPKEAMLMAKNPAVVQLLQQQKTQSENSALLGAEPEFGGARPAPVMSPPAQAPAPVTSPVPPLSRPVAGIQPDTVGTPAGYDWRAGGVPLPQEGPTPPSRPQDVSQGQQEPLGDPAPTQVAAAGNGPIKLPMPPPDDKRTIPQTPVTMQAAQAISSGGYGVPTTPDDAYARATALAKRMTLYEARGMKVDGLKPVLEGLLKLALPTDTQREIAAAYRDDPAKAQEMLRAAVDKRPEAQKNAGFVAPDDPNKQRALVERGMPNSNPPSVQLADAELRAKGYKPGTTTYNTLLPGLLEKYAKAEGGIDEVGTIPQDHRLIKEGDGSYRMEVIPGSKTARELADEAKKKDLAERQQRTSSDIVTQDIDRALETAKTAKLPVTGIIGSKLSAVPGSAAHDVQQALASVKANISFDRLQQMRASSPTGGALGSVTEGEGRLLQAAYGSLEQSQTAEQFERNLKRVRNLYIDIVHGGTEPKVAPAETPAAAGALTAARDAIAKGAPRERVIERLRQNGIDPKGL